MQRGESQKCPTHGSNWTGALIGRSTSHAGRLAASGEEAGESAKIFFGDGRFRRDLEKHPELMNWQ